MHPDTKKDLNSIAAKLSFLVLVIGVIPYLLATYKTESLLNAGMTIGGAAIIIPAIVSGLVALFVIKSLYKVITGR